jgi:hypothetical protein
MKDVKYRASMTRSAFVAMKGGQSTWEGLRTIQIAAVFAAAGSASLAADSAPLPL